MTRARTTAHQLTVPATIKMVTSAGFTQAEVGKVVGAAERTVQSWSAAQSSPTGVKRDRLLDLQVIVTLLSDVYTNDGIEIWLHSRNRNLDLRRPIDLLIESRFDEVVEEAMALAKAM